MNEPPSESVAYLHLERLRSERESEGIGKLIEAEIRGQLRAVARRWPPRVVMPESQSSQWTADMHQELAADFAEYLLRGRLSEIFDHAQTVDHFRLLLRMRARQFMDRKVRGGESENIWRRARELLESRDTRFAHLPGAQRRWYLVGGSAEAFTGDDAELRSLAWSLPVPPSAPRYRRDTQIASRVLPDEELCDLLEDALRRSPGALDAKQIRIVLDERLDLRAAETISISRRIGDAPTLEELLTDRSDPSRAAELAELVEDSVGLLTIRQLEVLGLRYAEEMHRDDTARRLGISNGTVDNELKRAVRVVLEVCEGDRRSARDVIGHILGRWRSERMG